MSDDTIVDVMYQCEQTLVGLLGKIKDADEKAKMEAELKDAVQGDLDDDEEEETPQFVVSESDLASTRPFNQRIHLPSGHDDMGDDDMMDDGGEVGDEEELTRDKVKEASDRIVEKQDKKKGRKGKKGRKKGGGFDVDVEGRGKKGAI